MRNQRTVYVEYVCGDSACTGRWRVPFIAGESGSVVYECPVCRRFHNCTLPRWEPRVVRVFVRNADGLLEGEAELSISDMKFFPSVKDGEVTANTHEHYIAISGDVFANRYESA